ncbi:MAG: signal peptide peptidase SppA [Spirochaetales bacterium]|nr:signal peptide peptidase SppA [Spirochaetales bacterium]
MFKFFRKVFSLFGLIKKIITGLIFWVILVIFIVAMFYNPSPKVREGEVLVLAPQGRVVDEYSKAPFEREMDAYLGEPPEESLLSDLKWCLAQAAYDERISAVLLDLSGFWGGGTANISELSQSMEEYKLSGKPLYCFAPYLSQSALSLASLANEVVLDPMGEVFLQGYGSYRAYMKEGLDDWGITAHIYRAGENKDFVAPYLHDSMTTSERNAMSFWMDDLWGGWLSLTAHNCGIPRETLEHYSNNYGSLLQSTKLSPAQLAMDKGLIDSIMTYDDYNREMISRFGLDDSGVGFSQTYWLDYMAREAGSLPALSGEPKIALLTLSGEILYGEGDWSRIGSFQAELILDEILNDPDVVALVLRINSPGGSAAGAEMIRRKLERFQDYGIPVYASIGNMAASGGYWIACEADEIWASETSLTGSIGVFSFFFTMEDLLKDKLGVTVDGYGTTAVAGSYNMGRDVSSETNKMLQSGVDQIYRQFLNLVATNRNIPLADVRKVAEGRVWTGRQALDNGLVDTIGTLEELIQYAAEESDLGGSYQLVQYDDNQLSSYGASFNLIPRISSLLSLPPLVQNEIAPLLFPEENPFGDPRQINAWSGYEVIQ